MLATVALIVFAQHTPAHGQRADEEVVTVATRPGVKQAFLLVRPPSRPLATVVVLVGGTGQLDLTPRGLLNARGLFGPRRKQLAGQGLVVALVDAPSDRSAEGLLNFRTSGEHAIDLEAVIHWLRQREPAPVWLVGISMGTVSAANAAARLGPRGPDGLVLISSVTRTHPSMGESLGGVSLEKVTVPTLVIHHRNDPCETAPYDAASVLPARLAATRRAELITLEGGSPPRGLPCSAQSFHGFFGMEDVLMDRLASWIKRTLLP
jgi:pimeloyl-ACP methyl ester carboxylesterase